MERPRYKTWIRTRPIVILGTLFAVCLLASALALVHLLFLAFLVPAAVLGYILMVIGLARWRLSPAGGDYQDRVHQLIVGRVPGGRVLDVGCGSGHLLAEIAHAHPAASLVGLDYWGDDWQYSQELCEANFRAERLDGRASFVRGSASRLPPDLGEFDCVVSCLTFHEVRDTGDKTVSVEQAVARLAPGGRFVFIDLFGDRGFYPDPTAIDAAVARAGAQITERSPLDRLMPMPYPLKHGRVLGNAVLIAGERAAIR